MNYSFLLAFVVILLSQETLSEEFTITDEHLSPHYWGNPLAKALVRQIAWKIQSSQSRDDGNSARAPLIPPDLIELLPNIPFINFTFNFDNQLLIGEYSHGNTELQGLNTLWDDLEIMIYPISLKYGIGLRDFGIRGHYNIDVALNLTYVEELFPGTIPDIPDEGLIADITGAGEYELVLQNVFFNISIAFNIIQGRIENVTTGLKLGLEPRIFFKDMIMTISGEEIPLDTLWESINGLLTFAIGQIMPEIETGLTGVLDELLTLIFKDCLIADFINGDFSCIPLIPNPPTTTTTAPTTTTTVSTTTTEGNAAGYIAQTPVLLFLLLQFVLIQW